MHSKALFTANSALVARKSLSRPQGALASSHSLPIGTSALFTASSYTSTVQSTSPSRDIATRANPPQTVSASASQSKVKDGVYNILVGDIGGTNARLQLWTVEFRDGLRVHSPVHAKDHKTADFPTFEACVEYFLSAAECRGARPTHAAFAVAGPVVDQICKMTNINWLVSKPALESKFGCSVSVLNDFEAIGYGIPVVDPNDIVTLNDVPIRPQGPIAVMGPGTGLGECQLFWDEGRHGYKVWPSEGSHADFAPRGALQRELAAWVEGELGFCEVEHVACGKGLERIAAFLSEKQTGQRRILKPEEVSTLALKGDPLCSESLDVFLSIVGAEAGHMALRCMASGGVYIAGGIPAKVIERVTSGVVTKAFFNAANSKFTGILHNTPLYVVRDPAVGLKGALEVAAKGIH